jgi:outer membrane lipoprotein-sorting protein
MLDYKEKGHAIQLMGNEDINGSSCYKLKLTRKSGTEKTYFVDSKTSFIVRVVSKMSVGGQEVESVMNFSNYQKLELGILVPFTMENSALPAPITMSKIEVNVKIEDAVFKVE